jgi:hypothetical protein
MTRDIQKIAVQDSTLRGRMLNELCAQRDANLKRIRLLEALLSRCLNTGRLDPYASLVEEIRTALRVHSLVQSYLDE